MFKLLAITSLAVCSQNTRARVVGGKSEVFMFLPERASVLTASKMSISLIFRGTINNANHGIKILTSAKCMWDLN